MTMGPRVLLIGPLPRSGSSIGGTHVSFALLVEGLRARGHVDVEVLDTTRPRATAGGMRGRLRDAVHALGIAWSVARRARTCDAVLFNASSEGFLLGGPLVWLGARVAGRPLLARAFGGGLDETFRRMPSVLRNIASATVLRSDLLLLQTRSLCESFASRGEVRHLPTSRRMPSCAPRASTECRRFLMLAQLRPEKGYREAIEAMQAAPEGCTLTIAGPSMPGTDVELLRSSPRVKWLGEVPPQQVSALLAEHDALLLPTYHAGEGLPGSIIEAFQHGLPVIASHWRSIPELVIPAVNGLLVEPRDVRGLAAAIQRLALEPSLFTELRDGALQTGREHSAEVACERIERWISQASGCPLAPAATGGQLEDVPAALPRRAASRKVAS